MRLLIVCVAILAVSCSSEPETTISAEPVLRPVRYTRVAASSGSTERTFTGVAKAGVESDISFKIGGTISELTSEVGDIVQPGDVLAKLDTRDYELKVEQAEASLAEAQAQVAQAEAEFLRVRSLYERENAAQGDYDAALAGRDSVRARVNSAKKALEIAVLQVTYATLRSPMAGVIVAVPVEANENVQPGTPIVLLNAGEYPEVEVGIPELFIADIALGASVSLQFDSVAGRQFRGEISEVAVTPNEGLTTYPVIVTMNQRWDELTAGRTLAVIRPGMSVQATFRFASENGASGVIVSAPSVLEDDDGNFVFVVVRGEGDVGTVKRRMVTVRGFAGEGIAIQQGIAPGEYIVTAGVNHLKDGQQVRLNERYRS